MRYSSEHKQETAAKILASVGRGVRLQGYNGAGVDILAQDAGVTSGAFYKHFSSKSAAFEAAVIVGLKDFYLYIEHCVAENREQWLAIIVDYYFSNEHLINLAGSCVVPSLTVDVSRGDEQLKKAYQAGLERIVKAMADGLLHLSKAQRRRRAWGILTMLSSGVQIARAVSDAELANEITLAMRKNVLQFGLAP